MTRYLTLALLATGLAWGFVAPLEDRLAQVRWTPERQIAFAVQLLGVPEPVCRMDHTLAKGAQGLWVIESPTMLAHCHAQEAPPCEARAFVLGRLAQDQTIRGVAAHLRRLTPEDAAAVQAQATRRCERSL